MDWKWVLLCVWPISSIINPFRATQQSFEREEQTLLFKYNSQHLFRTIARLIEWYKSNKIQHQAGWAIKLRLRVRVNGVSIWQWGRSVPTTMGDGLLWSRERSVASCVVAWQAVIQSKSSIADEAWAWVESREGNFPDKRINEHGNSFLIWCFKSGAIIHK